MNDANHALKYYRRYCQERKLQALQLPIEGRVPECAHSYSGPEYRWHRESYYMFSFLDFLRCLQPQVRKEMFHLQGRPDEKREIFAVFFIATDDALNHIQQHNEAFHNATYWHPEASKESQKKLYDLDWNFMCVFNTGHVVLLHPQHDTTVVLSTWLSMEAITAAAAMPTPPKALGNMGQGNVHENEVLVQGCNQTKSRVVRRGKRRLRRQFMPVGREPRLSMGRS